MASKNIENHISEALRLTWRIERDTKLRRPHLESIEDYVAAHPELFTEGYPSSFTEDDLTRSGKLKLIESRRWKTDDMMAIADINAVKRDDTESEAAAQ